jgi:hypothetical protein
LVRHYQFVIEFFRLIVSIGLLDLKVLHPLLTFCINNLPKAELFSILPDISSVMFAVNTRAPVKNCVSSS